MTTKDRETFQVYLQWANSILSEEKKSVRGVGDFLSAPVYCSLIDLLWPAAELKTKVKESTDQSAVGHIKSILEYLQTLNIKHSISAQGIVDGKWRDIVELLWIIILNFSIHTPRVSALQRNERMGRRLVLNWTREHLPEFNADHTATLVNNICSGSTFSELLCKLCTVPDNLDSVSNLSDCLRAADVKYGVKKGLLDASDLSQGAVSEQSLLIYLSLLRRKVKQKEKEVAVPAKPIIAIRTLPRAPAIAWHSAE